MGGDVIARSEPGVGSIFELFLPVQFGSASVAGRSSDAPARQLLVVDDEEAFRYVIRHIAQDAGFDVLEAGDGEAGLSLALERRPDVVLLDLQMPHMDGFAMLAALTRRRSPSPVIVYTSNSLTLDQKRSLAAAHAILPKQYISREGLTALMNSTLAMRQRPHDGGRWPP
jgi:CheY-like chemotaxis protein